MQQGGIRQAVEGVKVGMILKEFRAANSDDIIVDQPLRLGPAPPAVTPKEGDINRLPVKINARLNCRELNIDIRVKFFEQAKTWNQPFHRERRIGLNDQYIVVAAGQKLFRGAAQPIEHRLNDFKIFRCKRGHFNTAAIPDQKLHSQALFQSANLVTDRRWGHIQFVGCFRKTAKARNGLEGIKTIERKSLFGLALKHV